MIIDSWGKTDVGCQRTNNEDAFLIREDMYLYVVADGVGGAAAGEVASDLFVHNCAEEFETYTGWNKDYRMLITRCFQNANSKLREHMETHAETKGMGCTAELITFNAGNYFIGHVGDSRTYLIREGELQRLTKDHSYVQEQIDLGLLKPEEVQGHWMKNTIYRAVGGADELEVDLLQGTTKHADIFLLCSDGLTDMIAENNILDIIINEKNLQLRAEKLVQTAKDNGGKDNITIILCQVNMNSISEKVSAFFSKD